MQPTQLGPYRIGKPIGKGGMGSVYEAVDTQSGQRVAVKALSPHLAHVEGFRERFEAEIDSLKTLRHEGIVRLYGYGEQHGMLFYSMEYIAGSSLEDELKAGRRFSWRDVTDIAIQLAMALKHAHDHGIVHRDIKPANILFADDRHVKLADFGIARLFGNTSSLTTAGGVLGTADYMAPEQAEGRPVTARCDQYSLGGVMYALLAGRPPFRAKSLPEMLQLQRFALPEPVGRYAHETPKQLEQVIAQLLSKDPADRFPNTQVLARHLQAMVRALSRPTDDGFALAQEMPDVRPAEPDLENSLALAATQAEPHLPPSVHPLLLPEEVEPASDAEGHVLRAAETLPAKGAGDSPHGAPQPFLAQPGSALIGGPPPATAPSETAVFTTVEDDYARRQAPSRHWATVLAPLAGLGLALAAFAALVMYMSRPFTADQLHAKIAARIETDDADAIRQVEREINEFVERYPMDPRAAELRTHQQRIELDRTHRRLFLQARRNGLFNPDLLPVEVLYLEAMSAAAAAPESAVAKLESLIQLYNVGSVTQTSAAPGSNMPHANGDMVTESSEADERRRADCVRLAERQLEALRNDLASRSERQIAALEERLATAERLETIEPRQAAHMYRAIVDLYSGQAWAMDVVDEAQRRFDELMEESDHGE